MGDEISIQTTPSLPAWEVHKTEALPGTEDRTTKSLAPEQQATLDKIGTLEEQQKAIADKQLVADTAANTVHTETAGEMAEASAKLEKERQSAIDDTDGQIATWRSKLRSANDRYMSAPMPSLFGNTDTGHSVLKAIGLALAGIGQARYTTAMLRTGHDPGQSNAIDDIINQDFALQRENIAKLKDNALMAQAGVKDAEEARRIMLANIDVKQAAVYDRIGKMQAARLAATTGQPLANVKHDQAVADAAENAVKYRLSAVSGLTQEVTKKFGGTKENITRAPTEEKTGQGAVRQNKVYNDVVTAADAAKEIDPEAITPDILAKIQANQTEAEGAEHTGKVPVVGAGLVNMGREPVSSRAAPSRAFPTRRPSPGRSSSAWPPPWRTRARPPARGRPRTTIPRSCRNRGTPRPSLRARWNSSARTPRRSGPSRTPTR
jgi:hypothetical protein